MRKVLFKKWISEVRGWGDYTEPGIFHYWGRGYEVFESGPGNYTYAIVELADGSIVEVMPMNLKFVEPTNPEDL